MTRQKARPAPRSSGAPDWTQAAGPLAIDLPQRRTPPWPRASARGAQVPSSGVWPRGAKGGTLEELRRSTAKPSTGLEVELRYPRPAPRGRTRPALFALRIANSPVLSRSHALGRAIDYVHHRTVFALFHGCHQRRPRLRAGSCLQATPETSTTPDRPRRGASSGPASEQALLIQHLAFGHCGLGLLAHDGPLGSSEWSVVGFVSRQQLRGQLPRVPCARPAFPWCPVRWRARLTVSRVTPKRLSLARNFKSRESAVAGMMGLEIVYPSLYTK